MKHTTTRHLRKLEAHHRFGISLVLALIVFMFTGHSTLPVRLIVAWDAYALCLLALAWTRILTSEPRAVVRLATLGHTSRKVIFIFAISAACASLAAVAFLLGSVKGASRVRVVDHIVLAIGTVIISWMLVHTIFALQYAWLYYRHSRSPDGPPTSGGLIFPEETEPDYNDFAYFSFVIGMTCQVSDVQTSSREIRRWVLYHGVVSFGFNTAVLAFSINIISGLL